MAKETVFGTPVGATSFLPDTGCTLEEDPGWFSPELMMGTRDKQVFPMYGEAKFAGNVDSPLFPTNGLMILVAAIGTDAITGTVAPYTHTISQANALHSLTVEKDIGGFQSLQFAGCRIGKTSIKCSAGNSPVQLTSDVTARSALVMDTPTAISVTNEIPYNFAECSVSLFSNARADATSITIDIDNGLKESYTFSQQHGPNFITPASLKVSGTIDFIWSSLDDATYGDFLAMVNGTLGSLSATFAHPTPAAGSAQITLPEVVLSKFGNDLKVGDVISSALTFEGHKSLSSGYTVQAVLTNTVPTAY